MSKQVTWAEGTKTHDGNPRYSVRYDKLNALTKKLFMEESAKTQGSNGHRAVPGIRQDVSARRSSERG